jgi:hypothetical protein
VPAIEPNIRDLATRLTNIANRVAVFDQELQDPATGAVYRTAIKARLVAALQSVSTDLQALIGALS